MKIVLILMILTIATAFVETKSGKVEKLQQLQKKIDSLNTRTFINQRLFQLKAQKF